jgi:hypothetical protein
MTTSQRRGVGVVSRCIGYKRDGTPCSLSARGDSAYCWAHSPEHSEQRSQNAAKAGRAKGPGGEIIEVKRRIRELAEGVVEGTVDKGRASVAFQGLGVLCRFIEVERRVREQDELAAELAEIRAMVNERGRGWAG